MILMIDMTHIIIWSFARKFWLKISALCLQKIYTHTWSLRVAQVMSKVEKVELRSTSPSCTSVRSATVELVLSE